MVYSGECGTHSFFLVLSLVGLFICVTTVNLLSPTPVSQVPLLSALHNLITEPIGKVKMRRIGAPPGVNVTLEERAKGKLERERAGRASGGPLYSRVQKMG